MSSHFLRAGLLSVAVVLSLLSVPVQALPILVAAQLTGDARPANPDLLFVDVTITSDTTSNVADWSIQVQSPAHPDAKLDEFYFNMTGAASLYGFNNFNPASWTVQSPGSPSGAGAGNATFMFEATDPPPGPKASITNFMTLSFEMFKNVGDFTLDDFLLAPLLTADAGSGQLGAHLQSLTRNADTCGSPNTCNTNSGFAFGDYHANDEQVPNTGIQVPEPGVLALMGMALLLMGCLRSGHRQPRPARLVTR